MKCPNKFLWALFLIALLPPDGATANESIAFEVSGVFWKRDFKGSHFYDTYFDNRERGWWNADTSVTEDMTIETFVSIKFKARGLIEDTISLFIEFDTENSLDLDLLISELKDTRMAPPYLPKNRMINIETGVNGIPVATVLEVHYTLKKLRNRLKSGSGSRGNLVILPPKCERVTLTEYPGFGWTGNDSGYLKRFTELKCDLFFTGK